jgi:hypothetical protein
LLDDVDVDVGVDVGVGERCWSQVLAFNELNALSVS